MKAPITQSPEWKDLQDALGETSFFGHGKGYQYVAIVKSTPVGKYLYLPYGPVYDSDKGRENVLKALDGLANRHHAIFTRIEPTDPSFTDRLPRNARKTKDLSPKETWVLDLKGTDDDLKTKLPSRLLRYYKSASKKGLTIETSHDPADIHYLLDLQKALADKKGINTFSEKYLQTELAQPFATLYLVKQKGDTWAGDGSEGGPAEPKARWGGAEPAGPAQSVVAAGLVFDDYHTRYNLQGAQNDLGRQLHATGILTIQLILDAKAKGLNTFDFWGIAPDGAPKNHPWAGFTNFKKTFAGSEVKHAGTYDLVHDPKKYRRYQILRKLNRLVRKTKLN